MVEQLAVNELVVGSSPTIGAITKMRTFYGVTFLFAPMRKVPAHFSGRTRTEESCFCRNKNRRAGAQAEFCDGKTRAEGEKAAAGPTIFDEKVLVEVEKRTRGPTIVEITKNLCFLFICNSPHYNYNLTIKSK